MSEYQVIARKWRPQRFADVVGQQHVVRTLTNAIAANRTAHAYLFVGPRGVGKTTLARIFAKALNCEAPVNGEPCCRCTSCQAIAAERSLDIMEVDAASRNSTTDMRDLAEDVLTLPVSGKYKIYIIDEVHMLSKAAWNVLLKTVEEPPAHVKFIFATTEVHQVLPTIISRCQRFDLQPIQTRLISERLKLICETEHVAITPEAVEAIARAGEGGMRDAQSLLDQMIAFFAGENGEAITGEQVLSLFGLTNRADLETLLGAMLRNVPGDAIRMIGSLCGRGKNLETLFDDILNGLRAVQLCKIMKDPAELLDESPEGIARWRALAEPVPADTIRLMLEVLSPVGRVLHDALNKQVFLETIILKAMREAHAVRLDDILARLNQLRAAGELTFLDRLPPVTQHGECSADVISTQTPVPAPAPAPAPSPAPEPAPVPAPAPAAEKPPWREEPVVPVIPPTQVPEPAPEPEPAQAPQAEVSAQAEAPSPAPVSAPAEASCCTPPEPAAATESDSDADPCDASDAGPGVITEADAAATAAVEAQAKADDLAPAEAPHRKRRSVNNSDPEALNEVATHPLVREVLDLFDGQVIDVHR